MRQFAAIGEAMIELCHQQERNLGMSFAGDSLNTSVYLARLFPFTQTQINYITLLGTDPYSEMMLADWKQEGIHTAAIDQLAHKLPGLYLIRTDAAGERSFYFYRSQSAARELFNEAHALKIEPLLLQMDYLYLSNITLAILDQEKRHRLLGLLEKAKKKGAIVIFDTNYRPTLWPTRETAQLVTQDIMRLVDISLVTFDDEKKLFGDNTPEQCAERLHRFGAKEVVVKCGQDPCIVSIGGKQHYVSAHLVEKVVDTTSAGDAFNAGYLAARWQNYSPMAAACYGHTLASIVIQHPGAIIARNKMPVLF
jgi:2-dehydro-3-deoxygluconokinase